MLFAGVVQRLQVGRAQDVVRVHKGVVPPLGGVDAGVARGGQALVLLVDHPDALIPGGHLVAQLAAAVGGAVVHQDHLKGLVEFLIQDAPDAFFQPGLGVVDRHDHADTGTFHKFDPFQNLHDLLRVISSFRPGTGCAGNSGPQAARPSVYKNRCLNSV